MNVATRSPNGSNAPAFIQTLNWIFYPLQTLENRFKRFGETFRVLGNKPPLLVYFSSPAALETIFTASPEVIGLSRNNAILKPLLGEHSLILLQGEPHQRQRQLLMPPFHGDRMRAYGSLIQSITQQVIDSWQPGEAVLVRPAMQEISLRVILTTVFGMESGDRYEQLRQTVGAPLDALGSPLGFMMLYYRFLQRDWGARSPWGRFRRQKQQIDEILFDEIRDRRAHPDDSRSDILALLMAARDEAGEPMTDEELRDELVTLLFAGHETTASALAWALYWIASLPEVRDKLRYELGNIESATDYSAIARLPYLSAVCNETLRLYPIVINAFPRTVKQEVEIDGYRLPSGTNLLPSIYLAHRRPQTFPEPDQFRPERFLARSFSPYEFLPFGGGNRRCIGSAFALYEMKQVLFTLLSQVELSRLDDRPLKPVRRGITLAPPNHLRLKVTPF